MVKVASEPFADELAQRLAVAIGMIMEDEVDRAITTSPAGSELSPRIALLAGAGDDIVKLAAAADVLLRRYGKGSRGET